MDKAVEDKVLPLLKKVWVDINNLADSCQLS